MAAEVIFAGLHTSYLLAYLPTCLAAYLPAYLLTCLPAYLLRHLRTYSPTCILTRLPTHLLTHPITYSGAPCSTVRQDVVHTMYPVPPPLLYPHHQVLLAALLAKTYDANGNDYTSTGLSYFGLLPRLAPCTRHPAPGTRHLAPLICSQSTLCTLYPNRDTAPFPNMAGLLATLGLAAGSIANPALVSQPLVDTCTLHPAPWHPSPVTRHPAPGTLHPAPCAWHPAPGTLHPAPCAWHPAPGTPCTWHPAPRTLIWQVLGNWVGNGLLGSGFDFGADALLGLVGKSVGK